MSTPDRTHDLSNMALNLSCTADALDSAVDLLGLIGPRYGELDPTTLQALQPDTGAALDSDATVRLLAEQSDAIAEAVDLVQRAAAILHPVAARAAGIYPRA